MLIEADSQRVVHFLVHGYDNLHPCAPVVYDIRELATEFATIDWKHTFRKANSCADLLANHGHGVA